MSAELTQAMLTQIAFKRLSGKAMTSGKLSLPGETLGSTVQSSATTIFGQVVPNAPLKTGLLNKIQSASVDSPGTVQQVVFDSGVEIEALDQSDGGTQLANTIAPRIGFGAALGLHTNEVSTHHAYTIRHKSNYVTTTGISYFAANASTPKVLGTDAPFENSFMSTGSVQFQIVPEYLSTVTGTTNAYIPEVINTNGNVMTTTDDIDYYFDAMAGVLFVQDPSVASGTPSNDNSPGTLRAFLYVGRYQSEIEGDSVDLHFSASEGSGFSFANNATASFTSGSGGGLTVTAGATNNIEFELVNVISGSEQVQDSLDGVSLFRISSSTGTDDIDLQFGQTASFEDGGAGLTVKATGNTSKTVEIGAATDNVTFNQITGSELRISGTASINYLETIYETASIIYSSGSTKFGNTLDDFHDFTGSINLSSSGLDGFTWDTPSGSDVTIPLVYDVATKRVLTGSDYFKKNEFGIHLSASEGTGFSLTNLSTASFTTGSTSGGGLTITAGATNDIEYTLVGVISSSDQILDGTGILSSSTQDFATYSSSVETLIINATASITNNETDITNATASIADLVVSQSEGFLLRGFLNSVYVNGGNVLPFGTASFVGTNGIDVVPAASTSTQMNIVFSENDAPSTIAISASNGITSIAYGGTASFTSSGAGLSVGQTAGTVTYTITPDDVLNGATDTATFNFTSSNAVSASYALSSSYAVTASYAENAGSVSVTEDNVTNNLQTVIFSSLEDDDAGGSDVNEDITLKAASFLSVDAGRKYLYISGGDGYTRIEQDAIQTSVSPTYDILTTGTPTTINMGVAPGTVFFKGSASIDGDLIVNGTTTTINTDTLQIEDKYILLASGAAAAGGGDNAQGGGIVVERSAQNIGTALHWNEAAAVWAVDVADADSTSTSALAVDASVVFVKNDASAAPTAVPTIGTGDYRFGQMYVQDTAVADGNGIWIYAP